MLSAIRNTDKIRACSIFPIIVPQPWSCVKKMLICPISWLGKSQRTQSSPKDLHLHHQAWQIRQRYCNSSKIFHQPHCCFAAPAFQALGMVQWYAVNKLKNMKLTTQQSTIIMGSWTTTNAAHGSKLTYSAQQVDKRGFLYLYSPPCLKHAMIMIRIVWYPWNLKHGSCWIMKETPGLNSRHSCQLRSLTLVQMSW